MNQEQKGNVPKSERNNSFLIAFFFILGGALLLGRNLGFFDLEIFRIFFSWQVLLMAVGVLLLFKRSYVAAFVFISIGAFFFLTDLMGLSGITVRQYWPVILVLIGIGMLLRPRKQEVTAGVETPEEYLGIDESHKHSKRSDKGFVETTNIFGSIEQVVMDPVFHGARIKNNFGSTVLDLRNTRLEAERTYIDVDCAFGSVEILVPAQWYVQTELNQSLASFDDKRHLAGMYPDTAYCLVIRGRISFSSVEIK